MPGSRKISSGSSHRKRNECSAAMILKAYANQILAAPRVTAFPEHKQVFKLCNPIVLVDILFQSSLYCHLLVAFASGSLEILFCAKNRLVPLVTFLAKLQQKTTANNSYFPSRFYSIFRQKKMHCLPNKSKEHPFSLKLIS